MIWTAVATALALVLLIVFILQNQHRVQVRFFGLEGTVALGMALFIASVAGGVPVSIAGAARILQLRAVAHRRCVTAPREGFLRGRATDKGCRREGLAAVKSHSSPVIPVIPVIPVTGVRSGFRCGRPGPSWRRSLTVPEGGCGFR
jgi:uncharacterized integral membrane protein